MKNSFKKFDKIAPSYLDQRQCFDMSDSLIQVASKMGTLGGKDVIDLGCGGGRPVCDFFASRGAHVTGVDFSPEMLSYAKKNLPGVVFHEMDVTDWCPEKEVYDLVSCIYMIFCLNLNDQYDLIQKAFDSLRAGGLFFFCTLSPFDSERQEFSGVLPFMGEEFSMAYTSPEQYQTLLSRIGFEILESEPKSINGETMHWWIVKK